jgi:hypothetical protein
MLVAGAFLQRAIPSSAYSPDNGSRAIAILLGSPEPCLAFALCAAAINSSSGGSHRLNTKYSGENMTRHWLLLGLIGCLIGAADLHAAPPTTDAPALAALPGRIVIFRKEADGSLSYNSAVLTHSFEGWQKVPGTSRLTSGPAATAIGTTVYVVGQISTNNSGDGTPFMNQFNWGGPFVGWQDMHGLASELPPALFTVGESACAFEGEASSYNCWVKGGGGAWRTLPNPNPTVTEGFSGAAIGSTIYLAGRGKDSAVWINQTTLIPGQFHPTFGPAVGWNSSHDFQTATAPALISVGGRAYLFARSTDGRVFYNSWVPGGGGVGWKEMEGGGRIASAPAATAVGNHIFVAARGLDGNVILNQADAGHAFGQWFPVN